LKGAPDVFAILDASVLGIALMLFGLSHEKVEADPQAPKVTLKTGTLAWRFLGGSGSASRSWGNPKLEILEKIMAPIPSSRRDHRDEFACAGGDRDAGQRCDHHSSAVASH
jgi:hypothetical protein